MTTFQLKIGSMDNDAFQDGEATEVAAILRRIADKVSDGTIFDYDPLPVKDSNGATVGWAAFE